LKDTGDAPRQRLPASFRHGLGWAVRKSPFTGVISANASKTPAKYQFSDRNVVFLASADSGGTMRAAL
jgi:hypothetical protein